MSGKVDIQIEPIVAPQRWSLSAENIEPQPWLWTVKSDRFTRNGFAAFRWTAFVWARCVAWRLRRQERMLTRSGAKVAASREGQE